MSTVRLLGLFGRAKSKNLNILLTYGMLHTVWYITNSSYNTNLAYDVLPKQLTGPNSSFCPNSSKTDQAEQLAASSPNTNFYI